MTTTTNATPKMSEKQLMEAIIHLARLCRWRVEHTWISVRSEPGFPDLVMIRAGQCYAWEVKSATGKLTAAQEEWLGAFGAVPGVIASVIRPSDWTEGRVERWLV